MQEPSDAEVETDVQPQSESQDVLSEDDDVDWTVAVGEWGVAWPIHTYLSAIGFCILSLVAAVNFCRVLHRRNMPSKAYYLALNLVMLACCPGRAVHLLLDPYGAFSRLSLWQVRLTVAPFFPSITAAFILVFATLVRLTRMQLLPVRLFSPRCIFSVVFVNYVIGLTTDFVGSYFADLRILLLVCELYFTVWGLVAGSAYVYVFYRLYHGVVVNRRKMNEFAQAELNSISKGVGQGKDQGSKKKSQQLDTKMPVAAKITLIAATTFLSLCLLHVWWVTVSLLGAVNGDHWQWFAHNSLLRLSELVMGGTVLYIGALPFLSKRRK